MTGRWTRRMVVLTVLAAGIYGRWVRPRMLAWGSTVAERTQPLPADHLVPEPTHSTTHAITINAPPEAIWPWLVQMGQDRAGFYTHNWVERLLRSGIPDTHELRPEWQHLAAGDLMRTNRELRPGHPVGWPVVLVEPPRALALRSTGFPSGTYTYVLEPIDSGQTRLLVRDRMVWPWWQVPFRLLLFEPLHAYMETGVLQGIKVRAEGDAGARSHHP